MRQPPAKKRRGYKLKRSPLDHQGILRLLKEVLYESGKDRERAENLYNHLWDKVQEGANNINYVEDLRALLKSLELLTSTRQNSIKTIETLSKAAAVAAPKKVSNTSTTGEETSIFDIFDTVKKEVKGKNEENSS